MIATASPFYLPHVFWISFGGFDYVARQVTSCRTTAHPAPLLHLFVLYDTFSRFRTECRVVSVGSRLRVPPDILCAASRWKIRFCLSSIPTSLPVLFVHETSHPGDIVFFLCLCAFLSLFPDLAISRSRPGFTLIRYTGKRHFYSLPDLLMTSESILGFEVRDGLGSDVIFIDTGPPPPCFPVF